MGDNTPALRGSQGFYRHNVSDKENASGQLETAVSNMSEMAKPICCICKDWTGPVKSPGFPDWMIYSVKKYQSVVQCMGNCNDKCQDTQSLDSHALGCFDDDQVQDIWNEYGHNTSYHILNQTLHGGAIC